MFCAKTHFFAHFVLFSYFFSFSLLSKVRDTRFGIRTLFSLFLDTLSRFWHTLDAFVRSKTEIRGRWTSVLALVNFLYFRVLCLFSQFAIVEGTRVYGGRFGALEHVYLRV